MDSIFTTHVSQLGVLESVHMRCGCRCRPHVADFSQTFCPPPSSSLLFLTFIIAIFACTWPFFFNPPHIFHLIRILVPQLELTHAESVGVGLAGSDLHLAVRALGADLAGFGSAALLRESSLGTDLALCVSLGATLPDNTGTAAAYGANSTQVVCTHKIEVAATVTLCVLRGGARGQLRDSKWAAGTGKALGEAFRWGKCSCETD